jgi:hypothetical protein
LNFTDVTNWMSNWAEPMKPLNIYTRISVLSTLNCKLEVCTFCTNPVTSLYKISRKNINNNCLLGLVGLLWCSLG